MAAVTMFLDCIHVTCMCILKFHYAGDFYIILINKNQFNTNTLKEIFDSVQINIKWTPFALSMKTLCAFLIF